MAIRTIAERSSQLKAAPKIELHYDLIRNLTSSEEKSNGVQTWFANLSARELLKLDTQDNLRSYIAEHKDSKRNNVHKEISATITENPDRFINRNSGVTITCTNCIVDDNRRIAALTGASIINGAQTQGEIKRFFGKLEEDDDADFSVRAEIIMEPNHDQIVEVAIARNTATSVKSVSQASARGYLTELKGAIERDLSGETLQMNETDVEGLSAQAVLQWCRALMPSQLEPNGFRARNMPYKQGGKCLSDFSEWARLRDKDEDARDRYDFTVQMAATAVEEYRYWEKHDAWNGQRLHEFGKSGDKPHGGRPVRRQDGRVVWVAPGLLFPIMSAISAFVRDVDGTWQLDEPDLFDPAQMIERTCKQYRALGRDVSLMGRSEAAYDALSIYTDTIAAVTDAQAG